MSRFRCSNKTTWAMRVSKVAATGERPRAGLIRPRSQVVSGRCLSVVLANVLREQSNMRALYLGAIGLLAVVSCTEQPQPSQGSLSGQWLGGGGGAGAAQPGGSAANTTNAFDGSYIGISNRSAAVAGVGKKLVEATTTGCQRFEVPPTLTIANGLGQFQALGVTFSGYMTPQGHLTMNSGFGARVEADLDPRTHILYGRATSMNCTYDVNWQKTA